MLSQYHPHLCFNLFSISSMDPQITATLTNILPKRECLQMSCQAGIKTSDREKRKKKITAHLLQKRTMSTNNSTLIISLFGNIMIPFGRPLGKTNPCP